MNQPALQLDGPQPGQAGPGGRRALAFVVHGTPQPAGSKRAVPMGRRWGVIDDNKKSRPWKDQVAQVAGETMNGRPLMQGPLHVTMHFYVRRPKAHLSASGGLRASAPAFPTTKPDVLKLARGVEDAMSGVLYRDDAQIVYETLKKSYGPERVEIEVAEL